jgi:hypothetical protein
VCRRLLEPGRFLVMNETVRWFEGIEGKIGAFGFEIFDRMPLPRHCWWTDFYAPLEARARALRSRPGRVADSEGLARYESEIAMVKADPGRFDCGFYILVPRKG